MIESRSSILSSTLHSVKEGIRQFIVCHATNLGTLPGMLPSIKEKRCLLRRRMLPVIVTEFGYRQPFGPIILLLIDEDAKILLNILIHSLRLSISSRMKGGRSILSDAEEVKQIPNVFVDEMRVTVVYDFPRKPMIAEDPVSKDFCKPFCSKLNMGGLELDILGKSVNDDKNGVIAI
jgi:hypothetical protein